MKSVIITGGSAGIGEAAVKKFSAEGYEVFNFDINEPQLLIDNSHYINCDLSDTKQIHFAIRDVLKKIKSIDVVVSAAGQYFSGTIEDTSEEDFDRIINLNLKGSFFLLKEILPIMREQNHGNIVLIGSDQSFIGKTRSAVYGASKGAIGQLVKSTALDYADFNIRVNAVCPGSIDTPLYRKALQLFHEKSNVPLDVIKKEMDQAQPMNRIGLPEEVAELIYFIGSDAAPFITGSLFTIDGGYTAR